MYMNKISIYQLKSVNLDVLVTIPFFCLRFTALYKSTFLLLLF